MAAECFEQVQGRTSSVDTALDTSLDQAGKCPYNTSIN